MRKLATGISLVALVALLAACSGGDGPPPKPVYPPFINIVGDLTVSGAQYVRGNLSDCAGAGRYADLVKGAPVTVSNRVGVPLAVGKITYGVGTNVYRNKLDQCTFRFVAPQVPHAAVYQVVIGQQAPVLRDFLTLLPLPRDDGPQAAGPRATDDQHPPPGPDDQTRRLRRAASPTALGRREREVVVPRHRARSERAIRAWDVNRGTRQGELHLADSGARSQREDDLRERQDLVGAGERGERAAEIDRGRSAVQRDGLEALVVREARTAFRRQPPPAWGPARACRAGARRSPVEPASARREPAGRSWRETRRCPGRRTGRSG